MAGNFTILKTKKFWIILFVGFFTLFLFVFVFNNPEEIERPFLNSPTEQGFVRRPISQIVSPVAGTAIKSDFIVDLFDAGRENDLDKEGCGYSVYDTAFTPSRVTIFQKRRECQNDLWISVGEGKNCASQGKYACRVVLTSRDVLGLVNNVSTQEQSIRDFTIDWTDPRISSPVLLFEGGEVSFSEIRDGKNYNIEALVSDNIAVTGCYIYENDIPKGTMKFSQSSCKECVVSFLYFKEVMGEEELTIRCRDEANNVSSLSLRVGQPANHVPVFENCKVVPTRGTPETLFEFVGMVHDEDGDDLVYLWEFGDGIVSQESNPSHVYEKAGVYRPRVTVSDQENATAECFTAWVVIEENI